MQTLSKLFWLVPFSTDCNLEASFLPSIQYYLSVSFCQSSCKQWHIICGVCCNIFLWQWDDLQFICISNYSWIVSVSLTSHYLGFELVNCSHFNLLSLVTRYNIRFSGCSLLLVLYFMVFGGIHFECVSMTTIGNESGTMQMEFHVLLTSTAHIILSKVSVTLLVFLYLLNILPPGLWFNKYLLIAYCICERLCTNSSKKKIKPYR